MSCEAVFLGVEGGRSHTEVQSQSYDHDFLDFLLLEDAQKGSWIGLLTEPTVGILICQHSFLHNLLLSVNFKQMGDFSTISISNAVIGPQFLLFSIDINCNERVGFVCGCERHVVLWMHVLSDDHALEVNLLF